MPRVVSVATTQKTLLCREALDSHVEHVGRADLHDCFAPAVLGAFVGAHGSEHGVVIRGLDRHLVAFGGDIVDDHAVRDAVQASAGARMRLPVLRVLEELRASVSNGTRSPFLLAAALWLAWSVAVLVYGDEEWITVASMVRYARGDGVPPARTGLPGAGGATGPRALSRMLAMTRSTTSRSLRVSARTGLVLAATQLRLHGPARRGRTGFACVSVRFPLPRPLP